MYLFFFFSSSSRICSVQSSYAYVPLLVFRDQQKSWIFRYLLGYGLLSCLKRHVPFKEEGPEESLRKFPFYVVSWHVLTKYVRQAKQSGKIAPKIVKPRSGDLVPSICIFRDNSGPLLPMVKTCPLLPSSLLQLFCVAELYVARYHQISRVEIFYEREGSDS